MTFVLRFIRATTHVDADRLRHVRRHNDIKRRISILRIVQIRVCVVSGKFTEIYGNFRRKKSRGKFTEIYSNFPEISGNFSFAYHSQLFPSPALQNCAVKQACS